MGGKELDTTPYPLKIINYLNDLGAYALSIGMSAKEYWEDDPNYLLNFVKAEEIRQRKINSQLWLQGLYIYQAVGSLIHLANSFSKEHRAKPYLKQPIALTEAEREEQEREKYQRFVDYMMSKVKNTNGG